MIVIHFTAMNSSDAALERLCDPLAEVSAHYLISGRGAVTQMVEETMRAWHAGAGEWAGMADINSRSIGIELDNRGTHPFSEPQMAALELLLTAIRSRWPIAHTIGHSDMAPERKFDPGPHFDWARLARQGLANNRSGTAPPALDEQSFCSAARDAGFTADVSFETLLKATRLRCAPWRMGPLQADDFVLP
jgi:N-acetylmuramoyl-L-alanine amidase